jgi:hypothetical protein
MKNSVPFGRNEKGLFSPALLEDLFCAEVKTVKKFYNSAGASENDKIWLPRRLGHTVIRDLTQKRGEFYVSAEAQRIVDGVNNEKSLDFDFKNVLNDYYQKPRRELAAYKKREPFTIEHMFACMVAARILLRNEYDDDALKEFFRNYPVCWITGEESKKLSQKYKIERPCGPFEAYTDCGITIAGTIPEELKAYWKQKTEEANKTEKV